MYFMFKVKYVDHPYLDYATLDRMFIIKHADEDNFNSLLNQLLKAFNDRQDGYKNSQIDRVIIASFKINKTSTKQHQNLSLILI